MVTPNALYVLADWGDATSNGSTPIENGTGEMCLLRSKGSAEDDGWINLGRSCASVLTSAFAVRCWRVKALLNHLMKEGSEAGTARIVSMPRLARTVHIRVYSVRIALRST
jgi:hypothetical protein